MAENENRSSGGVKRKKTAVAEAEKSAKKSGPIWSRKDDITFVDFLVAHCEKGKGLPKIMTPLYDEIRTNLEGEYSNDQMYNKLRGLRDKVCKFRNKVKEEGFSFKNDHERTLYNQSIRVWGKDDDVSDDEKVGKRHEGEKHGEEREAAKRKQVKEGEGIEAAKRKQVKEGEGIETAKRKQVKEGEGREAAKRKQVKEGEGREAAKRKQVEEGEGKDREGVKRKLKSKEEETKRKQVKNGRGNEREGRNVIGVAESVPNRAGGREKGGEEKLAHGMPRQSNAAEKKLVCEGSNTAEKKLVCEGSNAAQGVLIGGRREPPSMQRDANDKPSGSGSVAATYQHNPRSVADLDQHLHVSSAARDVETDAARDVETNAASKILMGMFNSEVFSENMINELKNDIMQMVKTDVEILKNDIIQMVNTAQRFSNTNRVSSSFARPTTHRKA